MNFSILIFLSKFRSHLVTKAILIIAMSFSTVGIAVDFVVHLPPDTFDRGVSPFIPPEVYPGAGGDIFVGGTTFRAGQNHMVPHGDLRETHRTALGNGFFNNEWAQTTSQLLRNTADQIRPYNAQSARNFDSTADLLSWASENGNTIRFTDAPAGGGIIDMAGLANQYRAVPNLPNPPPGNWDGGIATTRIRDSLHWQTGNISVGPKTNGNNAYANDYGYIPSNNYDPANTGTIGTPGNREDSLDLSFMNDTSRSDPGVRQRFEDAKTFRRNVDNFLGAPAAGADHYRAVMENIRDMANREMLPFVTNQHQLVGDMVAPKKPLDYLNSANLVDRPRVRNVNCD